jgi:hypothetical protein
LDSIWIVPFADESRQTVASSIHALFAIAAIGFSVDGVHETGALTGSRSPNGARDLKQLDVEGVELQVYRKIKSHQS